MCFVAGAIILPRFFLLGGILNLNLIAALAVPAAFGCLLFYGVNRFRGVRPAMFTGALFVLVATVLVGLLEWKCSTTMNLPPTHPDNDATIRLMMLAAGYLTWAAAALVLGIALGACLPTRRGRGRRSVVRPAEMDQRQSGDGR